MNAHVVLKHQYIDLNTVLRADYNPPSKIEPDEYDWSGYLEGKPQTEIDCPPYLELYVFGDRPSEPSIYVEGEDAEKLWAYLLAIKDAEPIA